MAFDLKSVADILICPHSGFPFICHGNQLVSQDPVTRYAFGVENEIPKLLPENGEQLSVEQWTFIMKEHGIEVELPHNLQSKDAPHPQVDADSRNKTASTSNTSTCGSGIQHGSGLSDADTGGWFSGTDDWSDFRTDW